MSESLEMLPTIADSAVSLVEASGDEVTFELSTPASEPLSPLTPQDLEQQSNLGGLMIYPLSEIWSTADTSSMLSSSADNPHDEWKEALSILMNIHTPTNSFASVAIDGDLYATDTNNNTIDTSSNTIDINTDIDEENYIYGDICPLTIGITNTDDHELDSHYNHSFMDNTDSEPTLSDKKDCKSAYDIEFDENIRVIGEANKEAAKTYVEPPCIDHSGLMPPAPVQDPRLRYNAKISPCITARVHIKEVLDAQGNTKLVLHENLRMLKRKYGKPRNHVTRFLSPVTFKRSSRQMTPSPLSKEILPEEEEDINPFLNLDDDDSYHDGEEAQPGNITICSDTLLELDSECDRSVVMANIGSSTDSPLSYEETQESMSCSRFLNDLENETFDPPILQTTELQKINDSLMTNADDEDGDSQCANSSFESELELLSSGQHLNKESLKILGELEETRVRNTNRDFDVQDTRQVKKARIEDFDVDEDCILPSRKDVCNTGRDDINDVDSGCMGL